MPVEEPVFNIIEINPDDPFDGFEFLIPEDEPDEGPIDFIVIEDKPMFKNGKPKFRPKSRQFGSIFDVLYIEQKITRFH